jgi:cytochrome b6-f complex iron-sulfur subunit
MQAICGLLGWTGLHVSQTACAGDPPEGTPPQPGEVAVPLASLTAGRRAVVMVAGNPVEIRRTEAGVVARSLRCTHWGCVVRWKDEEGVYLCPCHEGRFDVEGAVLMGPPSAPLPSVAVRISGGHALVGAGRTPRPN